MISAVTLQKSVFESTTDIACRPVIVELLFRWFKNKSLGPIGRPRICSLEKRHLNTFNLRSERKFDCAGGILNRSLHSSDVASFLRQINRVAVEILHFNAFGERQNVGEIGRLSVSVSLHSRNRTEIPCCRRKYAKRRICAVIIRRYRIGQVSHCRRTARREKRVVADSVAIVSTVGGRGNGAVDDSAVVTAGRSVGRKLRRTDKNRIPKSGRTTYSPERTAAIVHNQTAYRGASTHCTTPRGKRVGYNAIHKIGFLTVMRGSTSVNVDCSAS